MLSLTVAVFVALITTLSTSVASRAIDYQWKRGRGSYFGEGDWPIHNGGCGFGHMWEDENPTGWDVAALADVHSEYVDSCGACYEVKCDPAWTTDNYGGKFDRTNVCLDPSASVVVRVVDTCQCTYYPNFYSNKRWCCGDVDHLDLSMWAFEKLAELRWGVISLQYRQVPCDHTPTKRAPTPEKPSPGIPTKPPPGTKRATRDWPEVRSKDIKTRIVFEDKLENNFMDASYTTWVQPLSQSKNSGMLEGPGLCAKISNGGALALKGWNGVFKQTVFLEFWAFVGHVGSGGSGALTPDITISIKGDKGSCTAVRLMDLKPIMFQPRCLPYCSDYWWGYKVYLPAFEGRDPQKTVINDPSDFTGCGGNSVWDLNTIEFRHDGFGGSDDKFVCLDHIVLS